VTFEAADGGFVITVLMEGASKATLRQDGREVLVSFSHPLPNFDAQALQDQAVGLLEGVSVGYDTLLLRLTPGVSVARMDEAGGLQLALQSTPGAARAATPPGQPVTEADKEGAQRLRLLAAQIAAQSGQISGARQQFGDLLLAMPGNPEPMTGLAGLEQTTGRWRQALDLYNRALQLDPGNPSVEDAISTIQRTHGSRLRADFEYRRTDGGEGSGISIAAIEGLSGQQSFNEGWQLAYSANLAWADATKVQQPNGAVENIIGRNSRGWNSQRIARRQRNHIPARRLPPAGLGFLPEPRRQRHQRQDFSRPTSTDYPGSDRAPGLRGEPLQSSGRREPCDNMDGQCGCPPGQSRRRPRALNRVCSRRRVSEQDRRRDAA
jgi:hypothetical protein